MPLDKDILKNDLHIWIIEDNENFRDPLCFMLELQEEISITLGFEQCEDALDYLSRPNIRKPDVILIDLGLPGMDGIEGIKAFIESGICHDLIVLTVFDDKPKVLDAILAGASGYLLKSSSPIEIVQAIREVMAGGSPLTPQIARYVVDLVNIQKFKSEESCLSNREREVLDSLANGLIKKEIASKLDISVNTVDKYVRRIYNKLQVNTLSGAVAKAIRERMI